MLLKHLSNFGACHITFGLPHDMWSWVCIDESQELYIDIGNFWYAKLLKDLVGESVLSETDDETIGDVIKSLFGWWWICTSGGPPEARSIVFDATALDLLRLLNDYFLHGVAIVYYEPIMGRPK